MKFEFTEATAPNIEELKRMAATKTDATVRLQAVEELGKWKSRQSIDILWRLMMNDLVYDVQQASFLRLQAFEEEVRLPKKKRGNLISQINEKIEKVVKSIEGEISYPEFIEVMKSKLPIEFDVYKHDKKGTFDTWLKNIISNFPKEVKSKIKVD